MDNAASFAQQIEELTQPCYKSTNHQACQASLDGLVHTLGVMGVITVGVIAGLILDWISPRILD